MGERSANVLWTDCRNGVFVLCFLVLYGSRWYHGWRAPELRHSVNARRTTRKIRKAPVVVVPDSEEFHVLALSLSHLFHYLHSLPARIIFSTILDYSFAAYKAIIFSLMACRLNIREVRGR